MAARFRYSKWDGTQQGYELDADSVIKEVTDELIHHGDPNAALRRIMQQGLRDRNGKKIEGLRDTVNRLRERRKQIRESGKLGGEFDGVAQELNDIIDEERLAVDEAERKAGDSGDERRAAVARDAAMNRKLQLDMLPDDLARKVEALSHYDFQSHDAQQRFEQLVERLREQVQRRQFEQISSAAKNTSPEDIARMKDMMSALNEMIDRRDRGEDPQFEKFMQEFGDFFPENPSTLDELLELLAQRMAAAQAMLNSMTPEQREELRNLMSQMLDDTDLQWQMDRLSERLQRAYPGMDWDGSQKFSGERPLPFDEALQSIQELNDLDNLEQFLNTASSPAALQEVDLDAVRRMLGDVSADRKSTRLNSSHSSVSRMPSSA